MESLSSVVLLGKGIVTGVMLTAMLGPVTMIILRNGLQINRMAGVWAAAGTWFSDFLFIGLTFWMTSRIDRWTHQPEIRFTLFLAGGIGLLLMGLLMLRIRQKDQAEHDQIRPSRYSGAFAGGFLVNSLSPFTLFFWLGAAVFLHLQSDNPAWYYAGLMVSLATGDVIKALLAPKLSLWLKEKNVAWVQIMAGIFIAATGLYVIILGFME